MLFLLFRAMKILLSTKKATAQTVASDNIMPYVICRFHEGISICRFHELSHIPFSLLSQVPDLLFWFYVYLLGFDLYCNLTHHLALYQVSVRNLERIATPLPSPKASRLTACGSLRLAVTTYDWTFTS